MKILLVNKFHWINGGSESYYFELGKKLKEEGHEVAYFSMIDEKNISTGDKEYFVDKIDTKKNNLFNAFDVIYSRKSKKMMKMILSDFKPDVVHLNNFNYQITPSILLEIKKYKKRNKCVVLYTSHDYQMVCPNHRLFIPSKRENCTKCLDGSYFNCLKNKCINNSTLKSLLGTIESKYWHFRKIYCILDYVVCPSNFIKEKIDTKKYLSCKTVVIPNFINIELSQKVTGLPQKYVLYFGRYSEEKGINELIEICKNTPSIDYVFVGDGELKSQIKDVKNIHDMGFKNKKELAYIIQKASFSICCSKWFEIFGLTIGETIKLGTPVIASKIGGIPEVVHDGKTGILFDPNNYLKLEEAIKKLWEDSNALKKYKDNCKNNSLLSIEDYYKRILSLYKGE